MIERIGCLACHDEGCPKCRPGMGRRKFFMFGALFVATPQIVVPESSVAQIINMRIKAEVNELALLAEMDRITRKYLLEHGLNYPPLVPLRCGYTHGDTRILLRNERGDVVSEAPWNAV